MKIKINGSRIYSLVALVALLAGCNFPVDVKVKLFPTATPIATSTPVPTPTITPSPTPSPTPTLPPVAQVKQAEQALFLGDYEEARREFQSAAASAVEPDLKAASLLGMGRALYFQQNYPAAIQTIKDMLAAYPKDRQASTAYFYLARAYDAVGSSLDAAQAYASYLELRPGILDDYMYELEGDAYLAAGIPPSAVNAYQAAIEATTNNNSKIWLQLKLGETYSISGDFSGAIEQYWNAYNGSDNDYIKAHANLLLGQAYLAVGQPDEAYARFQDSVNNFPSYYDTYSGLVELVNAGLEVNEIQRGLVDYYAGKYGLAIDAYNRFIDQVSNVDAAPYYYRALAYEAMNEPGNALADLDTIIQNYPGNSYLAKAVDEKSTILWVTFDKYDEAVQTLLQFAADYPDAPQSPDFLFQAARIQERNNQLSDAAGTWEKLMNAYPGYTDSYRGLFLAGISDYRAGTFSKALVIFQRSLVLATTPEEQAAADLWIGKTQKSLGNLQGMKDAWMQGAQADPTGYYSQRSSELLADGKPFSLKNPLDYGYDLNKERPDAENWLRTTFQLPPETNLSGLGELPSDVHFQRGQEFWALGLYTEARDEYEVVRKAVVSDPVATYRLMNYLYDLGVYRSAILCSRQILDLAGLDDLGTLNAPVYFNHIRFGIYYKDNVFQISKTEEINPLLFLSVMRQESLFEGFATSGSGARGLMQIMPATGQEIASNMQWPAGYNVDDLYRPVISIPMGARYLARQRDYFDGDIYSALAAYNGGPGNTIAWSQSAGDDPDLLLEVIRSDETRTYIMRIYEYFNLYRLIYERGL